VPDSTTVLLARPLRHTHNTRTQNTHTLSSSSPPSTHTCIHSPPPRTLSTPQRTDFRKSHLFDLKNGIKLADFERTQAINQRTSPLAIASVPADYKHGRDSKFEAGQQERLPAWVAYDRKVLRFYCYFKEAVHSSPVENFRIRRCILYFYIEDDSIHVAEPRIQNSGIPQGVFIKRHRVPKADGSFYGIGGTYCAPHMVLLSFVVVFFFFLC
jgi:hypothetical protein